MIHLAQTVGVVAIVRTHHVGHSVGLSLKHDAPSPIGIKGTIYGRGRAVARHEWIPKGRFLGGRATLTPAFTLALSLIGSKLFIVLGFRCLIFPAHLHFLGPCQQLAEYQFALLRSGRTIHEGKERCIHTATIIDAIDTTLLFYRAIGSTHQSRHHIQNTQNHFVSAHGVMMNGVDISKYTRPIILLHFVGECVTSSISLRHLRQSAMWHFSIKSTINTGFFYIVRNAPSVVPIRSG